MPAIRIKTLFHGLPEDVPEEGVPFKINQNPLVVPAEGGRIYILALEVVPTREELKAIAGKIEEEQKAIGNPVHVEVRDVKEKPIIDPKTGQVGKSAEISIHVVEPEDRAS